LDAEDQTALLGEKIRRIHSGDFFEIRQSDQVNIFKKSFYGIGAADGQSCP
jgi:hypothetical protein